MKQKFRAKKGKFWIYIVISLLLPIYMVFSQIDSIDQIWYLLPTSIPFLVFFWIYNATNYQIDNQNFYYQSAFLIGKIEINKITEI